MSKLMCVDCGSDQYDHNYNCIECGSTRVHQVGENVMRNNAYDIACAQAIYGYVHEHHGDDEDEIDRLKEYINDLYGEEIARKICD